MRASPPTTNIYIKIVGDDAHIVPHIPVSFSVNKCFVGDDAHIVPIFPVSFSAVKYFVGDDAYKSPVPTQHPRTYKQGSGV